MFLLHNVCTDTPLTSVFLILYVPVKHLNVMSGRDGLNQYFKQGLMCRAQPASPQYRVKHSTVTNQSTLGRLDNGVSTLHAPALNTEMKCGILLHFIRVQTVCNEI